MDWPVVGAWLFTFALLIGGAAYTFATFDERRRTGRFAGRKRSALGGGALPGSSTRR